MVGFPCVSDFFPNVGGVMCVPALPEVVGFMCVLTLITWSKLWLSGKNSFFIHNI